METIKFEKSILMSGRDYKLTPTITLHHPTVGEMLDINNSHNSEQIYWNYVSFLLSDPYTNMVFLDDMGKDFMNTTPFEVLILQWDNLYESYTNKKELYDKMGINPLSIITSALQFFIVENHNFVKCKYDNGAFCLIDSNDESCQINEEVYNYIYEWVKVINKIDYSERINPADENAKRILIEDARDEIKKEKRKKKNSKTNIDYIGSLMSAVVFGGNSVITPFNLNNCKIYWLFEAFNVDHKKTNASHILDGLYHGTLSSKDIDKKALDWTK